MKQAKHEIILNSNINQGGTWHCDDIGKAGNAMFVLPKFSKGQEKGSKPKRERRYEA